MAHALAFAWGAAFLAYLIAANYLGPQRRTHLILADWPDPQIKKGGAEAPPETAYLSIDA